MQTTAPTTQTPEIYVACLASYNNGRLHGGWIDASQSADGMRADIGDMLEKSPCDEDADEWAIHAYSGFGSADTALGENPALETVEKVATLTEESRGVFAELLACLGGHVDDAVRYMDEQYQGVYRNLGEWAHEYMDSTGQLEQVPEALRPYIDFDQYGRDAQLGGDILAIDMGLEQVHVFWSV